MKITCISNSNLQLLLLPETAIERAFLMEMASQAEKGATVALALPAKLSDEFCLEVGSRS